MEQLRCASCGAYTTPPCDSCPLCGSVRLGNAADQLLNDELIIDEYSTHCYQLAKEALERGDHYWYARHAHAGSMREYTNLGLIEGWPDCRCCGRPHNPDLDECMRCGEENPIG